MAQYTGTVTNTNRLGGFTDDSTLTVGHTTVPIPTTLGASEAQRLAAAAGSIGLRPVRAYTVGSATTVELVDIG